MLLEIDIENYAVAQKLRVRFRAGLNLLTGETGSGKSIIVDAFSLLLGARASTEVIRAGSSRAYISGVFEVTDAPALRVLLEASGVPLEDGEVIVEREVFDSGKSRAYVNGRAVTVGFLRELAILLGDIHGQHEQQDLFSTRTQLEMLDAYAGTGELVARATEVYGRWRDCGKRLDELRGNEQERLRLLDLYRFQMREMEEARIQPQEDADLEQQRRVLSNLALVEQAASSAYDLLYDSSVAAVSQIKQARRAVEELLQFDTALQPLIERLETAAANAEDAAFEIRSYLDRLEPDPQGLERIEDRLAVLETLKRKYGATLEEVQAYGEEVGRKLRELESRDATLTQVEQERRAAAQQYEQVAASLTPKRQEAASRLAARVKKELAALAMPKALFRVSFAPPEPPPAGWSATGVDRVGFLVSANPGQPPRALAQVASGGELSRITLALKTCLVSSSRRSGIKDTPRTLVFDEIDSGVGGRVAEALGRRLKRLSESNQVLCVTHLPQVAAFADAHYYVEKLEKGSQTHATVLELSSQRRIEELARMISGARVTSAAVEHAKQILEANHPKAQAAKSR